jgi:hypothetical protein
MLWIIKNLKVLCVAKRCYIIPFRESVNSESRHSEFEIQWGIWGVTRRLNNLSVPTQETSAPVERAVDQVGGERPLEEG